MKMIGKVLLVALIWICVLGLIIIGAAFTKGDPNSTLIMFLLGIIAGYSGAQLTLWVVM